MMRALVVYESMFGDTQLVAEAIAAGLSSRMSVDIAEVGAAPTVVGTEVDLLIVGGPTHAFGMSRPRTREDATRQAGRDVVSKGIGLREWLEALQHQSGSGPAAAFDTRINRPRLPGSAAHGAERRLRHLGFHISSPAQSFYVEGTDGPLVKGELERAQRWGRELGAALTSSDVESGPQD
jgi:hypothetical protein